MWQGMNTRREMLRKSACGFGSLALAGLAQNSASSAAAPPSQTRQPHFAPRAKRIIFIFMQGGPSHVDTFDYKPELVKRDGKSYDVTGVRSGDFGKVASQKLMKPLWKFKPYGQTGKMVSDLFPEIGKLSDDLCFLRGMHTTGVAHGPSTLFLHTGATNFIRPSVGSWITYGLGAENQNLPAFIALAPTAANGGPRNYSNAFLPADCQGTALGAAGLPIEQATINHIKNANLSLDEQERRFEFLRKINEQQAAEASDNQKVEGVIKSYELAFRMQDSVPKVLDVSRETKETLEMYGIGEKATDDFGKQCLLARRFAEAGVRYTQITYGDNGSNPRWDQHSNMPKHQDHALATDKPVAGLLADLKARGLLEDTLVWWGGEFGRTPFTQNNDGRDHNPLGFTQILAGAGVKKGFTFGETDELGHRSVDGKIHMHDLHATLLHLMGIDHKKLTYQVSGRNFRLTDVEGHVAHDILA